MAETVERMNLLDGANPMGAANELCWSKAFLGSVSLGGR